MAKEIQALAPAGSVVYAQIVRQSDGKFWNPAGAFETYLTANISSYALAMVQAGTASGFYTADFPTAIAAGKYSVVARIRAGGAPAEADAVIATGEILWTGLLPVKDMTEAVWRWYYKKNKYDSVAGNIKTYADDGTTVNTTATATVAAGIETQEAAT
jgi:hypothetical protein